MPGTESGARRLYRRIAATRNNALWCDAVCRSHGIRGRFHDAAFVVTLPVPRFYSNIVTLSGPRDEPAQRECVEALDESGLTGHWSVKDSAAVLELADLGFGVLFEATWLWRDAAVADPSPSGAAVQAEVVGSPEELSSWERAWNREPRNASATSEPRVFRDGLLADPDIAIIAIRRDGEIVAGAAANHTSGVVGLSNVFALTDDVEAAWAACVQAAARHFPDVPLVGYGHGSSLEVAQNLGFEDLGGLRVWIRSL
jgi:hypothetical protein